LIKANQNLLENVLGYAHRSHPCFFIQNVNLTEAKDIFMIPVQMNGLNKHKLAILTSPNGLYYLRMHTESEKKSREDENTKRIKENAEWEMNS
jgi:hypothetical protein